MAQPEQFATFLQVSPWPTSFAEIWAMVDPLSWARATDKSDALSISHCSNTLNPPMTV
jgi:hypothetical protein